MFEKREIMVYNGVSRDQIYPQICNFWRNQGFYVSQVSPYQIQGQSYYSKIGLKREFFLRLDEIDGNTHLDLMVNAKITDMGLIGGVAAAVIFLPVAAVAGAFSYTEYESDAKNLMGSFWNYVAQTTNVGGQYAPPQTPWTPPSQSEIMVTCEGCGALLPESWKACPYCGGQK